METIYDYTDLLNCAICFGCSNMSVIKVCILGHSVCCQCYNNMGMCPYCRSPWSRTRNRNLEQLIAHSSRIHRSRDLINDESLKCPRCHSLMDGGIFLCGDGHSICTECVKDIYQCVLCPKLICYRRNFSLERLIESVKHLEEPDDMRARLQGYIFQILKAIWRLGLVTILRFIIHLLAT